jgi:prepilin-type N-terminal cleavage/methylation domain-containing protein
MGRSIKVLQEKDIKGFTLLELLVVVALIAIITAIGIPNFSNWKKDREVRVGAEKIAAVISGMSAQAKRGTYPYIQVLINSNVNWGTSGNNYGTIIRGNGMTKSDLSKMINGGTFPNCGLTGTWTTEFEYEMKDIYLHFKSLDTICFSRDEKYYMIKGNNLPRNKPITLDNDASRKTSNYIIVCSMHDVGKAGKCNPSNLKKPAYLISWTRFGNVKKFRWSGNDWVR